MKMHKIFIALLLVFSMNFNAYSADFLTLSGSKLSDSQIFEGKDKTILLFWTTWCPYCGKQLSYIRDKLDYLEKNGIKLYLINTGESQNSVMNFAKKYNIPADKIILNKSQSLAVSARIMGFPTYVVLYKGEMLTQVNILDDESLESLVEVYDNVEKIESE